MRPNGSLRFFRSGTNTELITFKDDLETIQNPTIVLVLPNGNVENVFYSGSAKVIYLDEFDVQYAERDPVGAERELGNFSIWDTVVSYDINNIVQGSDGKFYVSLSNANIGNDPTITPSQWEEWPVNGIYNANIPYSVGEVVQTTVGNFWKSLVVSNLANNPETDDGTNWEPAFNDSFKKIIVDTVLKIGNSYFSTVTKSHTVPAGVNTGDKIIITWKDGTTMTLTSASNMSVTGATKTTDTTWVFTNFITVLTLVWDGAEWGIK
jgi:hypothetical protein